MTNYDSNRQPLGLPLAQVYTIPGGLAASRYNNWTAGINQQLNHNLFVTARYLAKRGNHGLTYVSAPSSDPATEAYVAETVGIPVSTQAYSLANLRRDRYDSVEITAHQVFGKQYQWMASYVRSRATSTAVFNQSIDQSLNVSNNFGPLPKRLALHFQKTPQDLTARKVQATAVATSSTTGLRAGYKSPLITVLPQKTNSMPAC